MTPPTIPTRSAPPAGGCPGPAPRRRGFLLLTIMVLIFVATLMIGWGLKRATMQSRIADLRVQDYRMHHERLGLIALAERWMRQESPESLIKDSKSAAAAYIATLPDDTEITIHVRDGQDRVLSRVESVDPTTKQFLLDALKMIPDEDAPLAIRSVGPPQVSLLSTDDLVLEAVAGVDDKAMTAIRKWEADLPEDDQALALEINRADLDDVTTNRLTQLLTVHPTLWRLITDVRDEHGSRRYEILIEFQGNQIKTHSCRLMPESNDDDSRNRSRRAR